MFTENVFYVDFIDFELLRKIVDCFSTIGTFYNKSTSTYKKRGR